jgi:hypothetical protein
MDLGGMVTAIGGTQLQTKQLGGRPFDQNGISYWEADWPQPIESSPSSADRNHGDDKKSAAGKESTDIENSDKESTDKESYTEPQGESPAKSTGERYLF